MAGLGFKTFNAASVLTAADLQGYAVDQSVMVFATAAARTSALTSPSQGMMSFLNDSGTTWIYYAAYNASTNPGGAASAGWYPAPGSAMFFGQAQRSAVTGTTYTAGSTGFLYTEYVDGLNWHSTVTNTSRITPTVRGLYQMMTQTSFSSIAAGSRVARIAVNGSSISGSTQSTTVPGSPYPSTTLVYFLNGSTDYVEFLNYQDSGGSVTVTQQVSVTFLRPIIF
jgi:hypothetical protein